MDSLYSVNADGVQAVQHNEDLGAASRAAAGEQVARVKGACRCLGLSSRQDAARGWVKRQSSLIGA